MGKFSFVRGFKGAFGRFGFKVKKRSPEILVAVGTGCVIAGTVLACRATLKVKDVVEESKSELEEIKNAAENPELAEKYTEEDRKKDTALVHIQTGIKIVKLYLPSVIVGSFGIGCFFKSNDILKKRNVALAAAYATVDRSFKEYRERVKERFGEEVDRQLKYNIKAEEVKEQVVDENGKKKTVKKKLEVIDPNDPNTWSEYAKFFDAASPFWEKDPELSLYYLKSQQAKWNNVLHVRGYVFLNEVYDSLGIPKTKAGQVVGWRLDEKDTTIDNYIDFGIYQINKSANRDFVNGYEPVILLDFNVDGPIWEKVNYDAEGGTW